MFWKILVTILILNTTTYALFSMRSRSVGAPNLTTYRDLPHSHTVSYIIAGNLNQASSVIKQLAEEIPGTVKIADFDHTGYDPNKFIRDIEANIASLPEDTEVLLVTLSLGTQPGQTISNHLGAPLVAINPCMNSSFLQPGWKTACYATYIIGAPIKYLIGWASLIPGWVRIIDPNAYGYGLATLIEQYRSIVRYAPQPPNDKTVVIMSERDQILLNDKITEYFSDCPTVTIDSLHGDTNGSPDEYRSGTRQALEQLRQYNKT